MDNKTMAIIGAVVLVVIVGAAAFFLIGGDGEEQNEVPDDVTPIEYEFKFNGETRLGIFGNVDGNDDLNKDDVKLLKDILNGKVAFDSNKNCFADTNADGKLDKADVELLETFVDKKPGVMSYLDSNGGVSSIKYPLSGKIIVHHVYPLDACIILGLYDDVIGMSNQGFSNAMGRDTARYPGMGEKIINIGTPRDDPQAALKTNADVYLTPWYDDYTKMQTVIDSAKLNMQIVQLPFSLNGPTILDQDGSLLSLAVMFQLESKAHEYIDFADKITKELDDKMSGISDKFTFITPMKGKSTTEVGLDVPHPDGTMPGDVYTISKLPMVSVNPIANGCPKISMEEVYKINPDVIVIIMFHDASHSVEDIRNDFEVDAQKYKLTDAYKNQRIYGVNYYNIANYCGTPQLPLLASYIWPELFDEDKGWEYLQTYFDKYTMYENPVVKEMGNAFAMSLN